MDRFPAIEDLERRAKRRLPHFSWEYLASGTGDESAMHRNRSALLDVELLPQLMKGVIEPDTRTMLFGVEHAAPIGVAPLGMSGLIWPGADQALARTARANGFPHVLSTVATTTPEDVGPLAGDMGWFQLYPPRDDALRSDLLDRVEGAGYRTLVITADVPKGSRRERQRKAHIRVPPKITPRLMWQSVTHPAWSMAVLRHGIPRFRTIEQYIDGTSLTAVAGFVGASLGGSLSFDYVAEVRARWTGNIVVKGILDPADARRSTDVGADAVWVSNHGGRQLEASPAAISCLPAIAAEIGDGVPVLFDSGVRSGADIARAISLGADFVFAGRPFYFGLGALGADGAGHAYEILHDGLLNVMHQTGCVRPAELRERTH
ncbi:MAG: alpha-hydroxy-acid oxidizing enzyme [Acidimicrobiaceae bacterium]|nr:alpha-hydroxy-acid oxidizing enzyme [Acidimicrobiaceae bacterium]HAB58273.1 alpha-hydroxy-acid oxidizing enzyme [Acidimicrobiaceae bacterium]